MRFVGIKIIKKHNYGVTQKTSKPILSIDNTHRLSSINNIKSLVIDKDVLFKKTTVVNTVEYKVMIINILNANLSIII